MRFLQWSDNSRRATASFAVVIELMLLTSGQMRVCGAQPASGVEPRAAPTVARGVAPAQTGAAPGSDTTPAVDQPRPFGYVLGDTLTQRVLLDQSFQPEGLPPLERASLWFSRRTSTIQRSDDNRRWLVMQYQLVNAPQALVTVNLPEVTLRSKTGGVLKVPVWPVSVTPLTPHAVFAKGGLQELRADHPAPMLPTSTLRRELEAWLTAFAVIVAAWFTWWLIRSVRAARNQPFARAQREIRQIGEDNADAWLALHRAFDRTAGRALQTSTLPALFKQAPHFESQRGAIEEFYSQSNLRFFGGGATEPLALSGLAATLRRIEKQHER
ncbi:MAG: hypothetical protein JSR66_23840 [Proteobacteria bacterium]|nr:hypothetical protein [Pseudomonadota bacterium]